MSDDSISLREAQAKDIPALCEFLFDHGANEWNHLPEEPITAHLNRIADGLAYAVLAEENGQLIGFVSFELGYEWRSISRTIAHRRFTASFTKPSFIEINAAGASARDCWMRR